MSEFVQHLTAVYELPLAEGVRVIRPEQVVLKFESAGSVDVGSLCYLRRGKNKRLAACHSQLVDISSYDASRSRSVVEVIRFISDLFRDSGLSHNTLRFNVFTFISDFMTWSDHHGHYSVLVDHDAAREAFRGFVGHLRDQAMQNRVSVNIAAGVQYKVLWFLENFLGMDDLARGVNLLRRSRKATEETAPPCEETQGKVLALCESLFIGLTDLTVDHLPYPFSLKMPEYLQWENNALWVFPCAQWCVPPGYQQVVGEKTRNHAYNHAAGRIATLDEIKDLYSNAYDPKRAIKSAQERIATANRDTRDYARIQAAQFAHNAFAVLFVASIAMNRAQVLELPWGSDDYKLDVERQGFRTLKWRAGGRACHFEISPVFIPKFQRFLELRRYLLNGKDCEFLFFTLGTNANKASIPQQMGKALFYTFGRALSTFDPVNVTPREWRAAKSDWLVKSTDLATAALVLQTSEGTFRKHYTAGSSTQHLNEMSAYFDRVAKVVADRGQIIEGSVERATGMCASYGAPHEVAPDVPVTPDCRTPEGCLFCDKFKVHADEKDTRKLLSCRFCLLQTAPLASSEEQFQRLFAPILERIQSILDEIEVRKPGLVPRIKVEVEEEGELDPYWAGKMEMLMDLELVSFS